jgi:hypothetical protein
MLSELFIYGRGVVGNVGAFAQSYNCGAFRTYER